MNYFVENTDPFNTEDPFKQDPFKTVSFADDPFAGDPFHVSGAFLVLNLVPISMAAFLDNIDLRMKKLYYFHTGS